jgi:proteasome accessory factor B
MLRDLDRAGGCDLYELAQRYGTSVRTVRRDFEALEHAGIPLHREAGTDTLRQRWSIDAGAVKHLSRLFDASHYLALRIALDQAHFVKSQSSLFAALEDLMGRVEQALGPSGRKELEAIDACFFSWEKFAFTHTPTDVVWPLVSAISGRRACQLTYRSARGKNAERRFTAHPLRLFMHAGTMYVHAWHSGHKKVVVLSTRRIEKLRVLRQTFTPPKDYTPERLEESAFWLFVGTPEVSYRVRFDAEAAPHILERSWHPTQVVKHLRDGGVELSFRCAESYEVTAWVASWREHAELLEPARVRDELKALGETLAARYSMPAPRASKGSK